MQECQRVINAKRFRQCPAVLKLLSLVISCTQAANQPVAQKAVASDGSSQVQSGNVTQQGLVPDVGRSGPLEAGSARYAKPLCCSAPYALGLNS